jgi:hypothetical protein
VISGEDKTIMEENGAINNPAAAGLSGVALDITGG